MNKPHIIRHRVNKIEDLRGHKPSYGIEIDLRSDVNSPKVIHLSHDAWVKGDDFKLWLDLFVQKKVQGTLILNTKEDGLEIQCLEMMIEKNIENFFFLDTAIPTLVKLGSQYREHFSVRYSAFENLDFCLSLKSKAAWVWVDCFDKKPAAISEVLKLKNENFKICVVSPELQGGNREDLNRFQEILSLADAVCTKFT